jgi:hypothetical protein
MSANSYHLADPCYLQKLKTATEFQNAASESLWLRSPSKILEKLSKLMKIGAKKNGEK